MKAEFIASDDGDDLRVVNAARVSFHKESDWEWEKYPADVCHEGEIMMSAKLSEADQRLIKYLANHDHFTPFTHCRITFREKNYPLMCIPYLKETDRAGLVWDHHGMFRHSLYGWASLLKKELIDLDCYYSIAHHLHEAYPAASRALQIPQSPKSDGSQVERVLYSNNPEFIDVTLREKVPIFVARQRFKHMVGFTYNEVSRRYVDDAPEFFTPDEWRAKPINAKQGSSDEVITELETEHEIWDEPQSPMMTWDIKDAYNAVIETCSDIYELMIKNGVAPEQARMVLPQSMYTSYYVTGSLASWARAYKLRTDSHAQLEIQELAKQWKEIVPGLGPYIQEVNPTVSGVPE